MSLLLDHHLWGAWALLLLGLWLGARNLAERRRSALRRDREPRDHPAAGAGDGGRR